MEIKICGITNIEDAQNAIALGVDALGFIFAESSPRCVTPEVVEEITHFLPPFITLVGVFVNQDLEFVNHISERCHLDLVQLHGDESPEYCTQVKRRVIKAFRIAELDDLEQIPPYQGIVSGMVLDTKVPGLDGGTGQTFDWGIALKANEFDIPLILSGGINASNVQKAVQLVNPYAIDLSSGVESEIGKKDYNKMQDLLRMV